MFPPRGSGGGQGGEGISGDVRRLVWGSGLRGKASFRSETGWSRSPSVFFPRLGAIRRLKRKEIRQLAGASGGKR